MQIEILFIILVSVLTVVFLVLKSIVPVIQQRVINNHEINLKEIELEKADLELDLKKLELERLKIEKGIYEESYSNRELSNLALTFGREIDNSHHNLKEELWELEVSTKEELASLIDRVERLELNILNGVKESKLDIEDDETKTVPSLDDLDYEFEDGF